MKSFMCLDIESTGLSPHSDQIHGIAISCEEDAGEYFMMRELPEWFRQKLADPSVIKIAFNAHFDLVFLAAKGFEVRGVIIDVLLQAKLIDENQPAGLKYLSEKYLGKESLSNKHALDRAMEEAGVKNIAAFCALDLATPGNPYKAIIGKYSVEDQNNTLRLAYVFKAKLAELDVKAKKIFGAETATPLTYWKQEVIPVENVLLAMETEGVAINTNAIEECKNEAERQKSVCEQHLNMLCRVQIAAIEDALFEKELAKRKSPAGKAKVERSSEKYKTKFSWESGAHLGRLVYEHFALSPALVRKTEKGSYLTSEVYLKFLKTAILPEHPLRPVLDIFGKWKKAQKIASTYTGDSEVGITSHIVDNKGTPYIFGRFPQTTNTGRLAPKEPNLANLPRTSPVKRFFVPKDREHVFAYFDFSQVELRIAAHLSRDEELVDAYTLGADLHRRTASNIFGVEPKDVSDIQRQVGKTCNFLLIYNGSAKRLNGELSEKNNLDFSLEECMSFREAFFATYKTYAAFLRKQLEFMKKYKMVISENGRIRRLPDIVYGDFLNWKTKTFTGPPALAATLKETPYEKVSPEETFWRANRKYSHATKAGYNFPVQGLGASITKRSMIELHKRGFRLVNQIHDAIIIELPVTQLHRTDEIKEVLETTYPISVPLKAEMKLLNSFEEKDVYSPNAKVALADDTIAAYNTNTAKKG